MISDAWRNRISMTDTQYKLTQYSLAALLCSVLQSSSLQYDGWLGLTALSAQIGDTVP